MMAPLGPPLIAVSGAAVSTVKLLVAGSGSILAARSMALTANAWGPSERPLKSFGDEHELNPAPSRLHSNVPASVEMKVKLALLSLVNLLGPPVIVVSGRQTSGPLYWIKRLTPEPMFQLLERYSPASGHASK